jgi:hypothetical protein
MAISPTAREKFGQVSSAAVLLAFAYPIWAVFGSEPSPVLLAFAIIMVGMYSDRCNRTHAAVYLLDADQAP